jgi:hypothetical protein
MYRRVLGWVLAIAATAVVAINQRDIGIARDEVVYLDAGDRYAAWWRGLLTFRHDASEASITGTFGGPNGDRNNPEHPPLMKTLFGTSKWLLHDKVRVFGELTAARFPSAAMHGALVWTAYAMVLEAWGLAEAVLAALLLVCLPRALFYAGLACLDAAVMTLWFATIWTYWRGLDRRGSWQAGVVFGLALATKHTALLLPFALVVHYLALGPPHGRWRDLVLHRWRLVVSMAVLAPLTFAAVWPWMWFDPIHHVRDWLAFHENHVQYNYEYLGRNWNAPPFPWHVALVTTLLTLPVATLVAACIGAGVWIAHGERDRRRPALLLALSAGASIGPFLLGGTPIYGAEKHWMPVLPTICVAAAVGIVWAARQASRYFEDRVPVTERLAIGLVGAAVVGAAAVETAIAQPYALTSYNALAGGAPGGADLGMNRQFWGVAARGILPRLALEAPTHGTRPVYSHDASPAWGLYMKYGLVPASLPDSGHEQEGVDSSQLAIVVHELHFNRHDYMIWKAYGTVQPIDVLRADGVPIVSLYRRPR